MRRRLQLSLNGEFSSLKQDEAAFLYEIDLARLDAAGKDAVGRALHGDLSALNLLEPESAAHGFTVIQTRTGNLRRKRISWRINLLGIVNVLSLSELVRRGAVIHDPESGDLVITDEVTSARIGAVSDSKNIRKAVFECAMLSASYKAAGVDVNSDLKASQTFFALDPNANRQKMKDFLDAVAGLGLMTAAGRDDSLRDTGPFGSSTLLLETEFDQRACEALFLDESGAARPGAYYERVGRNALLSLIQPGDPDDYRRIPADTEALWQRMKAAGQFNFKSVLPAPITGGSRQDVRVGVVIADFTLITWWAEAMAAAATSLLEVRRVLGGASAESLQDSSDFRKARAALERAMAGAIRRNKSSFGDAWGVLAMFNAAGGAAVARATVTSPRLTLSLPQ
jgi:hypothetical protein